MTQVPFALIREHMLAALSEARSALDAGKLPVGAVIVYNGAVVATGRNAIDVPADDTHHAELSAIQRITPFLAVHKRECEIYTTLEPCMMYLGAIINAGIQTLIVAAEDPLVGALSLLPAGQYYREKASHLKVHRGCMAAESQALLNAYVRKTGGRRHLATNAA